MEDQVHDGLIQPGDDHVLVGEQPAVDVGEGGQVLVDVGVPVLRLGVQDAEEVDEGPAGVAGVVLQVPLEHAVTAENAGVLRVQAEHQPDAEGVEAFQGFGALWVLVLLQQGVVQHPHDLPGLEGDLHLLLYHRAPCIHQELETVVFLFQVGQDIVNMLSADGKPDGGWLDAACQQAFLI